MDYHYYLYEQTVDFISKKVYNFSFLGLPVYVASHFHGALLF
jgi:hypothetical protein